MKFEEIFNEPGLYRAESFSMGFALEVRVNTFTGVKELYSVNYKHKGDIEPEKYPTLVYAELFKKDYINVYTRQSLFEPFNK